MPHRCTALLALALLAPLSAQEWVTTDATPSYLSHTVFDRVHQRLLALGGYPMQTWSMDGAAWHLHTPDGIGATNAEPVVVRALGYDEVRGEVVAAVERYVANLQTLDTFVTRGAGWQLAGTGSTVPAAAATAFDWNRNQLITFGGIGSFNPTDSMFAWNGTSWTQLNPAIRPAPRTGAAMATDLVRNRVVLFGGRDNGGYLGDTWEWDGSQWQQFAPAVAPSPRETTMAYDPVAQRVVLIGSQDLWSPASDCWEWDGAQWSPRPAAPAIGVQRAYDDGTALTLLVGAAVYRATPTGWTQVFTPDELPGVDYPAITYDLTRGETLAVTSGPRGGTWRWNGAWNFVTASGPGARRRAALAPLGTDVVLFGGIGSSTSPAQLFDDTWSWNGQSWASLSLSPRPSARHGHAMVTTNNGVLLFGGQDLLSTLGDTWRFDGVAWTDVTPANSPGGRVRPGMAFDPVRQRVVLYGGQAPWQQAALDDTWEWNGSTWSQVAPGVLYPMFSWSPLPLVFDGSRGQVVLADSDRLYGWNGVAWSNPQFLSTSTTGVGVYDAARQRIVTWSVDTRVLSTTPAAATVTAQACGSSPDLRLFGRAALGTTSEVHAEGMPGAPAFVVFGLQAQVQNLAPGCNRLISTDAARFVLLDPVGCGDVHLPVPDLPAFRGLHLFAQVAVVDGGPVSGVSVSGALNLVLGD